MKKINFYFIGLIFILSNIGCKDNCVGFRDEPKLTFTTELHTPVEIYYVENNNQYLGTMDSGSSVHFGINPHYTGMNFIFKYPSGPDDVFALRYDPYITYQNKCDFQIYFKEMRENFSKINIYKNYSFYKSPRPNHLEEKVTENGYTVEFR